MCSRALKRRGSLPFIRKAVTYWTAYILSVRPDSSIGCEIFIVEYSFPNAESRLQYAQSKLFKSALKIYFPAGAQLVGIQSNLLNVFTARYGMIESFGIVMCGNGVAALWSSGRSDGRYRIFRIYRGMKLSISIKYDAGSARSIG